MPLSVPTAGNGLNAGNYDFPLPAFLKRDVVFYANLVSGTDHGDLVPLKRLLNAFIKGRWYLVAGDDTVSDDELIFIEAEDQTMLLIRWETILGWEDIMRALWAAICKAMYETNKSAAL